MMRRLNWYWRLVAVSSLLLGAAGCGTATAPRPVETKVANPQTVGDKTLLAVSQAIRRGGLTQLEDECLSYQFDAAEKEGNYVVDVRENHRSSKCGGDPNVSPRLFSVKVNKQTGAMTTDQGSVTGEFHPIRER